MKITSTLLNYKKISRLAKEFSNSGVKGVSYFLVLISAFMASFSRNTLKKVAVLSLMTSVMLLSMTYNVTAQITISVRVNQGSDDAEQEGPDGSSFGPGGMYINSSDIEFVTDFDAGGGGTQQIGMRFNGLSIPRGAIITNAYIVFRAMSPDNPNTNTGATSLVFRGQAADNPTTFTSVVNNISSRPNTTASVPWVPTAWVTNTLYSTPALTTIVQEIVNRSGWAVGNSMVFFATGSGSRTAESYEGNPSNAPELVVTYIPFSPGGLTGLQTWFKADAGVTTSGSVVTSWTNENIRNTNIPNVTGTVGSTYNTGNSISYLPSVSFTPGASPRLQSVQTTGNNFVDVANGSTYTLLIDSTASANDYAFGWGNNVGQTPTAEISTQLRGVYIDLTTGSGGAGVLLPSLGTYSNEPSIISSRFTKNTLADDYSYFNGKQGTVANVNNEGLKDGRVFIGGVSDGFGHTGFDGVVGEVMSFNTTHTLAEKNKVESYLAAKWGVTLDQSTATNYTASDGSIFWNATTNAGFKNRLTIIGRDDISTLNKKQSATVHAGLKVTMGLGSIAANNAANANTFASDFSFDAFGDDNGSIASFTVSGAPTDRKIITRKWKVQESGTVGTVRIQVPDDGSIMSSKLPVEENIIYILLDADGDFRTGAVETAMTLNGTNWEANVNFTNGQFFTFGTLTPLISSYTQTNVNCFGSSTGAIDLTVSGGVSPYTYLWNDGVTTQDRSNLPAGTYSVTATDNLGTTTSKTVTIIQLSDLSATVTKTNISCFGETNGKIELSVITGGSFAYEFRLDSGVWQSSATFSNLPKATYNVQMRDANYPTCFKDLGNQTITEPIGALNLNTDVFDVKCNGGTNGSINLTVTGGTAPYFYEWESGTTVEDRKNLSAGTYSVTVIDANSCSSVVSVTVNQPAPLSVVSSPTAITCFSDGFITLNVTGGTTPYSYNWADVTGNKNAKDRSGLTAGSYSVTVTDANGCTTTSSQNLVAPVCDPNALSICQSDTSSNFSVDPDPMVDSYSWTVPVGAIIVSGQGTPSIIVNWAGVAAGSGQVCVRTVNVCAQSADVCFDVNVRYVAATASVFAAPVCTNENLELQGQGGAAFVWSGPNGFKSTNQLPIIYNPSVINDGIYKVTVTDTKGCIATDSITVSVKTAPTASSTAVLAGCLKATGSADLTVISGATPYTYMWSNGETTEDLGNIAAGIYTVTITDDKGCELKHIVPVGNTPAPTVVPTVTNVACAADNTGAISLSVTGTAPPFSFNWSTSDTTQNIANLTAGIYNVTITDDLGCKSVATNKVTEPNALQLDKTFTNVDCFGTSTGTITVTVAGGTGAYTFDWADIAGSNDVQDRTNLAAGTYYLTVTDANGCMDSTSVNITEPILPLTVSTTVIDALCNGGAQGVINLTIDGGTLPYSYAWADGATTQDRTSLPAGTYNVTITDGKGCTTTTSGVVNEPPVLLLTHTETNVSCYGGNDGAIDLTISGGTAAYTYLWSDGDITEDISVKPCGYLQCHCDGC